LFVGLIGERDELPEIRSTLDLVALELWRSDPDHRDTLQACLLEAFAKASGRKARNSGAVLAQLLGSSIPTSADELEEYIKTARANLQSSSDAEAILGAFKVLALAFQPCSIQGEGLEEELLALLNRGGAPAHAAAWVLTWLSMDRVAPGEDTRPFIHDRLGTPLSGQHHGRSTRTGWRPSHLAAAELVRALERARVDEIDLKCHLISLLGLAGCADIIRPLLARLDESDATVRGAIQLALASLAKCVLPLSDSLLSELETELKDRLLHNEMLEESECAEALVLLALFEREEQLRQLASDDKVRVLFRRGALECIGLLASRSGAVESRHHIEAFLEEQLRADALDVLVEGIEGWAEHDVRIPPLHAASRAMQMAMSADLPLLGSGPGRVVPMLTLAAQQGGEGLRIHTEVVTPAVWKLPLPDGEQLELVVVDGGVYQIGTPEAEYGSNVYPQLRQKCVEVNVEVLRRVTLSPYALVRHPITQAQWRSVASLPRVEGDINPTPSTFDTLTLWERFAQPGCLPVECVSWNDCQEWLRRLNRWMSVQWPELGRQGEAPQLVLPSESQWEVACRAVEPSTAEASKSPPFNFGDTLDASWANYHGGYRYGPGRQGNFRQRPVPVGFFGLVNRWGLAEMHGQVNEWCADRWHRDPLAGSMADGSPVDELDLDLEGNQEQPYRVLRGGSWLIPPPFVRASFRYSLDPADVSPINGFRPCCLLPPGSLIAPTASQNAVG
jgi:formylglycine-generating enzyme required for sulfatase activity